MKIWEKKIEVGLISLLALILIVICVQIILVTIYSYGEKECLSNPIDYANNYSNNYWWDYAVPVRINFSG